MRRVVMRSKRGYTYDRGPYRLRDAPKLVTGATMLVVGVYALAEIFLAHVPRGRGRT